MTCRRHDGSDAPRLRICYLLRMESSVEESKRLTNPRRNVTALVSVVSAAISVVLPFAIFSVVPSLYLPAQHIAFGFVLLASTLLGLIALATGKIAFDVLRRNHLKERWQALLGMILDSVAMLLFGLLALFLYSPRRLLVCRLKCAPQQARPSLARQSHIRPSRCAYPSKTNQRVSRE